MNAVVEYVVDYLKWFASNFQNNALHMFDGWNWKRWIRLIIILGGYLLFRPYMEKWASKLQGKEHEKDVDFYEEATKKGKLSPNALRDGAAAGEESEEEAETSATDWGKKARKRQRQMERKKLEEEEKKRLDAEGDAEDKDIKEYLVDYVEGEDGW